MRLLYVEDEERLAKAMKRVLEEEGYAVDLALDGEEGLYFAENCPYDLILLDRKLPKMDGLNVLRKLREKNNRTPVIMLTALGELADRVTGLQDGADDYLVKPFAFEELLERIRSVVRRSGGMARNRVPLANLVVDLNQRQVLNGTCKIQLTPKEFSLLEYFLHNQERAISRTELTEHLYNEAFDRDSNLIDVFIHKLRKKLEKETGNKMIQTVRGAGYMLAL